MKTENFLGQNQIRNDESMLNNFNASAGRNAFSLLKINTLEYVLQKVLGSFICSETSFCYQLGYKTFPSEALILCYIAQQV